MIHHPTYLCDGTCDQNTTVLFEKEGCIACQIKTTDEELFITEYSVFPGIWLCYKHAHTRKFVYPNSYCEGLIQEKRAVGCLYNTEVKKRSEFSRFTLGFDAVRLGQYADWSFVFLSGHISPRWAGLPFSSFWDDGKIPVFSA